MTETDSIISLSLPLDDNPRLKRYDSVKRNEMPKIYPTPSSSPSSPPPQKNANEPLRRVPLVHENDKNNKNKKRIRQEDEEDVNVDEEDEEDDNDDKGDTDMDMDGDDGYEVSDIEDDISPDESVSVAASSSLRKRPFKKQKEDHNGDDSVKNKINSPTHVPQGIPGIGQVTPNIAQKQKLPKQTIPTFHEPKIEKPLPIPEMSDHQMKYNNIRLRIDPEARERTDRMLMSAYQAEIERMANEDTECSKMLKLLGPNPDIHQISFVRSQMIEEMNRTKYGEGMAKMTIMTSKFASFSGSWLKNFGLLSHNPLKGIERDFTVHKDVLTKCFKQMHMEEGAMLTITGRLEFLMIALTCCQAAIERNSEENELAKQYTAQQQIEKQKRSEEAQPQPQAQAPITKQIGIVNPPKPGLRTPPPPPPPPPPAQTSQQQAPQRPAEKTKQPLPRPPPPPPTTTTPVASEMNVSKKKSTTATTSEEEEPKQPTIILHMTDGEREMAKKYPQNDRNLPAINLAQVPNTMTVEDLLEIDGNSEISVVYES